MIDLSAALSTALDAAQLKRTLTVTSGSLGLLWYYVCLVDLGFCPTAAAQTATGFRQFQSLSITTISVSLATYVGSIIGLPQASSSGAGVAAGKVENLQLWSAGMYVLSLIIAVGFYYWKKDETEPALTNLAKSLLGFVAGVFSVSLTAT